MKPLVGAMAALAMLGIVGVASAAESSGTIEAIEPASRSVKLDDGNTYVVHAALPLEELKEGRAVKVTFIEQDGQRIITGVRPAE